jgi:N utilization substance protein B
MTSRAPTSRARGRELGLWLLCHVESHPKAERAAIELFWREPPEIAIGNEFVGPLAPELAELLADRDAQKFANRIVDQFLDNAAAIDAKIEQASARWRLARMDRVDRNLLRIAAVELSHESTPRNVVVAEAVRLAARYGSERSPAFVNGLAEALARDLRDSASSSSSEADLSSGSPEEREDT